MVELVWFKRDLRVHDHRPLAAATAAGPVLPVYVVEPGYWRQPDTAHRHWAFIRECLLELDDALRARGSGLVVREGAVVDVLAALHAEHGLSTVHAHEETGNDWTYRRDRAVADWCRQAGVALREVPQFGVVRPLANRDRWAGHWEARMREAQVPAPATLTPVVVPPPADGVLPQRLGYDQRPTPGRQSGGRRAGLELLASFLTERGENYRQDMASPLTGEWGCSRLSPHIAYGSLSLREIVQAHRRRWAEAREAPRGERGRWAGSLKSFESRLHWHCHFMQKLEDQPDIEFRNLHRGYDGMRENDFDPTLFEAWCEGRTGLPFVDACMRMLHHVGWINFRMRAMLMAVAGYHLWLHWREPALHLARLFVDYEPGIHYSQSQMQTGTTGINTLRIYNPVKQSWDQDPEGAFIRRWIPALAGVPTPWVHEPWRLPPELQARYGCRLGPDYPHRVVDHQEAAREARRRIKAHRAGRDMKGPADDIRQRHASRAPAPDRGRRPRQRRKDEGSNGQGSLDL